MPTRFEDRIGRRHKNSSSTSLGRQAFQEKPRPEQYQKWAEHLPKPVPSGLKHRIGGRPSGYWRSGCVQPLNSFR
jgi:hypothetical protein